MSFNQATAKGGYAWRVLHRCIKKMASKTRATRFSAIPSAIFISVALFFASCNSHKSDPPTLKDFASELPIASRPGPGTYRFIAHVDKNMPPDRRLAQLVRTLSDKWEYVSDLPDEDHFADAETMFLSMSFRGDCEDFAAAVAALCKAMQLNYRVVLAERNGKGHVWTEVQLSNDHHLTAHLKRSIETSFGPSAEIISNGVNDGYWLRLQPKDSYSGYQPTHYIEPDGKLQRIVPR